MAGATHDVVVVGAGLSGLAAAREVLSLRPGARVAVYEARARVGGRALATPEGHDLGGAWCWPHANPRLVPLAAALGVRSFPQPGDREPRLSDLHGAARVRGSQQGWVRFEGGAAALAARMADALRGRADLELGAPVARVSGSGAVRLADGTEVSASAAVIVAVPPRVAARTIEFAGPPLPPARLAEMRDSPTWMGGAAKVVVRYGEAFWRADGLSGTAFPPPGDGGPLAQVYDATAGGAPALAGFAFGDEAMALGRSDAGRAEAEARAVAQLARLFGARAAEPASVVSHSWRGDRWTTPDAADPGPGHHPRPRPALARPHGRVLFAGAETSAAATCGLLDGAIEAGQRAAAEAVALM